MADQTRRASPVLAGMPVRRKGGEKAPLGVLDRMVVRLADGTRSIDEIAELLGMSYREAASIAQRLVQMKILDLKQALELELGADGLQEAAVIEPEPGTKDTEPPAK